MPEFQSLRHSHYVSDLRLKDAAGCEVCHGPASDHVADPDHRKIERFTVGTSAMARRVNEVCAKCHQETISRPHYLATEHARSGISCASCHEVHYDLHTPNMLRLPGVSGPAGQPEPRTRTKGKAKPQPEAPATAPAAAGTTPVEEPPNRPKLERSAKTRVPIPGWRASISRMPELVTREQATNELCSSCHRRELTESRLFSHHPLFEGRVQCTDCHDPHRAERGRMLKERTIEETCLRCHENLRGPFVYEHEPVKSGGVGESCLECHRPHGSPNRNLTVTFGRGLCVQCHSDIQRDPPHRGRTGDCWRSGCHAAIHGSNHSPQLFRE
jgi:predicted CXXCH cytochrome family protein